jgi:hypothetical protein
MGTQPGFAALPPARKRIPFNEVRQQIITSSTGLLARLTARFVMPTFALLGQPQRCRNSCYAARAWKICNTRCLRFLPVQKVKTSLPEGVESRPAR